MKEAIERAARLIEKGKRFLVTTHRNPEGDALGSALALANAFQEAGKEVVVYNEDEVPYMLRFLPMSDKVVHQIPGSKKYDAVFVVDCGDLKLVGEGFEKFRPGQLLINVDHHITNPGYGEINIIDPKASASGEVVYHLLKAASFPVTSAVASCIYTAIYTDTGAFHYSNASPEAMEIAAQMIRAGASPARIAEELYDSHPKGRLDLLGLVLQTLEVRSAGEVASIFVTQEMFRKTGTSSEHVEGFVGYPRSIRGVQLAFSLRELETGKWRISFRSKGKYDVARLAAQFEGGGHHNAAGGNIQGILEEVKKKIYAAIDWQIKEQRKS
ncbi:MAG: bifunctional oligoribonuclease/PAP phosphatase NrnA [Deltaproteobacteria bacterium]|nr:bifunctional oligoribonuclease/PAP phosphatase NrnA [Deltaproteobacteria bacterium]